MSTLQARPYLAVLNAVDHFKKVRTGGQPLPQTHGEQTKWVWFSQHEIERLLSILSDKFPNHSSSQKGLKIYLGMYPNETDSGHNDGNSYTNRLCLALVPSRIVEKGGREIIMDYGKDDAGTIFTDISTHQVFGQSPYDNVGSLCPPRCQVMGEGDVF